MRRLLATFFNHSRACLVQRQRFNVWVERFRAQESGKKKYVVCVSGSGSFRELRVPKGFGVG